MDLSAEKIVKNYEQLKGSRERFTSLYDKLHRFFYVEGTNVYPDENNADLPALLDSTSLDCADVLAAGLSNYLTPESSNWVYLEHPNRELRLILNLTSLSSFFLSTAITFTSIVSSLSLLL